MHDLIMQRFVQWPIVNDKCSMLLFALINQPFWAFRHFLRSAPPPLIQNNNIFVHRRHSLVRILLLKFWPVSFGLFEIIRLTMDISLLKTVCFTCLCAACSLCCATSKILGAYRDHGAKSKVAAAVQSAAVNNNTAIHAEIPAFAIWNEFCNAFAEVLSAVFFRLKYFCTVGL